MVATKGLVGLRPSPDRVAQVTSPPYDVIKPGSALEARLSGEADSLFHVILGETPEPALRRLVESGALIQDDEPAYYVYAQTWAGGARTGVFAAAEVTPYEAHQIIRHEKTFDNKVRGRVELRRRTNHTMGPVFVLTRAPLGRALENAKNASDPVYDFVSDFGGISELHGMRNQLWRVPEESVEGQAIKGALAQQPLYIADGHHRYHASLLHEQTHFLCYVTEEAVIQAYNRVINGTRPFAEIADQLELTPTDAFVTPDKHQFCIYTGEGSFMLEAREVPDDVVGRLDCAILERELYPLLGLRHEMIADLEHFDYYSESALDEMRAAVDRGDYDIAVALHPVSLEELTAVADAGLVDTDIVMPEKSTFFAPKILSGLFLYRHDKAG